MLLPKTLIKLKTGNVGRRIYLVKLSCLCAQTIVCVISVKALQNWTGRTQGLQWLCIIGSGQTVLANRVVTGSYEEGVRSDL